MSLKTAILRVESKPHIDIRLNVFKSNLFSQNYNNEMAVQFCYEQNKKRKLDKNK